MKKKRSHLVLLTTDFKPNIGGIAQYLHSLWHELSQFEQTTVISTIPRQEKNWTYNYNLKILSSSTHLKQNNNTRETWNLLRDLHPQKEIIPFLKTIDADSLEVFIGVWHPISHFWCRGLLNANIDYSIFVYGKELLDSHYQGLAEKRAEDIQNAKRVYCCSDATCELTKSIVGGNLNTQTIYPIIRNLSESNSFNDEVISYQKRFNLTNKTIILSLSRLVHRKGIDLALESFAALMPKYPNTVYLIAGEGEKKEQLEQYVIKLGIRDNVLFLGSVDDSTKTILFKICDIFVLPIRQSIKDDWEGFGITFLEIAIARKPSIAGKTGGVIEAIEDKITGFLVNTVNCEEISQAMDVLLSDKALRTQMGNNARKYAEKFTGQSSAIKLLKSVAMDKPKT